LLCSKVPILKKRESEESADPPVSGPIFLNADEFAEKYPERAERVLKQTVEEDTDETTDCTKSDTTKSESENTASTTVSVGHKQHDGEGVDSSPLRTPKSRKSASWATRLFSSEKFAKTKTPRERISTRERKQEEVMHQMKIESVLPIKSADCRMMISRDSSSPPDLKSLQSRASVEPQLSKQSSPSFASPKSCKSSTSSLQIVVPSQGATDWRQKQLSYGKNTVGYRNFLQKYPNKDLRFRHMHSLVSTPDAKEKIGKKRWVGKYQKWRKFLHQFDSSDSGEDTD